MTQAPTAQCVLTGFMFRPRNPEDKVSQEARDLLKIAIRELFDTDQEFRKAVMTAILQDSEVATSIASAMLATKAKDVGLMTSGSIADLFCKRLRNSSKQETPKTS